MIVANIRYYTTVHNDKYVKEKLMKIIDEKRESNLWSRIKYAFDFNTSIQGDILNDKIYFYRKNGYSSDIFYVEYHFKSFKIEDRQFLKVISVLNPVGLIFTGAILLFFITGLLNELGIGNHEINLLGGFLISMCFYGVVFIAYKMNRDSTINDIEKLLKLKRVKLKKAVSSK